MKITFLGTRGYLKVKSRLHHRHASAMIGEKNTRVMIDCGLDWTDQVYELNPDAIIITHAHPDHAFGLQNGAPCPVYATAASWQTLQDFPIKEHIVVYPRMPFTIGTITIEAFEVIHSIRAPAVGYRISTHNACIFYVPDLIDIKERAQALNNIDLYIGDGASPTIPMVRRKGSVLFGHTTIRAQLGWCALAKVPRAIFTHCGTRIVSSDGRTINAKIRNLGKAKGVPVAIAHDNMEIIIP